MEYSTTPTQDFTEPVDLIGIRWAGPDFRPLSTKEDLYFLERDLPMIPDQIRAFKLMPEWQKASHKWPRVIPRELYVPVEEIVTETQDIGSLCLVTDQDMTDDDLIVLPEHLNAHREARMFSYQVPTDPADIPRFHYDGPLDEYFLFDF
jgi:hypothetical protein